MGVCFLVLLFYFNKKWYYFLGFQVGVLCVIMYMGELHYFCTCPVRNGQFLDFAIMMLFDVEKVPNDVKFQGKISCPPKMYHFLVEIRFS